MSAWSKVGDWIKDNAGNGASLVGSLLTGNVQGAIAAGISIISGATGTNDPDKALNELKNNPEALLKLKELYYKNEDSVRVHIESMERLKLEDLQSEHKTTSSVIVEGQKNADGWFEKNSRQAMAWVSLVFSGLYVQECLSQSVEINFLALTVLSSGYFAWMGLRTIDKRTAKK